MYTVRERERERERFIYLSIYRSIYLSIYLSMDARATRSCRFSTPARFRAAGTRRCGGLDPSGLSSRGGDPCGQRKALVFLDPGTLRSSCRYS